MAGRAGRRQLQALSELAAAVHGPRPFPLHSVPWMLFTHKIGCSVNPENMAMKGAKQAIGATDTGQRDYSASSLVPCCHHHATSGGVGVVGGSFYRRHKHWAGIPAVTGSTRCQAWAVPAKFVQ